jgi:hypothetical protein
VVSSGKSEPVLKQPPLPPHLHDHTYFKKKWNKMTATELRTTN